MPDAGNEATHGIADDGSWTAMFPLGGVLFPGVGLPLRIFEPRYRVMLRRCIDRGEGFGVVLIASGNEVGGNDDRFDIATMTEIVQADVAEDGTATVIVAGRERVRVHEWLPDRPFPRARIGSFDDADLASSRADDIDDLARRCRRLLAQRTELGLAGPPVTLDFADDPGQKLWQLCAIVPAAPHDDLALLATPTVSARIELARSLVAVAEDDVARRLGVG